MRESVLRGIRNMNVLRLELLFSLLRYTINVFSVRKVVFSVRHVVFSVREGAFWSITVLKGKKKL